MEKNMGIKKGLKVIMKNTWLEKKLEFKRVKKEIKQNNKKKYID